MDRTTLTVLGTLLLLFMLMVLAAMFGGPSNNTSKSGVRQPVKKFRAKPGTQRENARALISSTPSIPSDLVRDGGGSEKPIEVWGHLGDPNEEAAKSDPGLSDLAVSKLLQNTLSANQETGDVHILEVSPANFKRALMVATAQQRSELIYLRAKALLASGEETLALEALQLQDERSETTSPREAELAIMEGVLLESSGDSKGALSAYRKSFDSVKAALSQTTGSSADIARQAALRLSRLYRKLGNDTAAQDVSREFKLWLAR